MPLKSASLPIGIGLHGIGREPLAHLRHGSLEVRTGAVHFINESNTRNLVLVGLPPNRFGLRLNAADRAEYSTGAVKHTQAAFNLDGEVHMTGVSMILTRCSRQKQVVAALVIVMPRSRSCSIQSMVVVPSWTSPTLYTFPV